MLHLHEVGEASRSYLTAAARSTSEGPDRSPCAVRIRAKKKTKGWRTISGLNDCCEIRAGAPERQRRVLQTVLAVNVATFVTEVGAGLLARSTALLTDSVDMLGRCDRVRFQSVCRRAWSSLAGPRCTAEGRDCAVPSLKGTLWPPWALSRLPPIRSAYGCCRGTDRTTSTCSPLGSAPATMSWRIARCFLAAGVVLITRSPWPDIAVGLMIAALFGSSAITVVRRAILELRRRSAPNPSDSAVPLPYILP
jgi:hypothetical protein